MKLESMSSDDKIAYLIKPILRVLQESGGQLERQSIKDKISELDEDIAEYAEQVTVSKKTGKEYKDFDFSFNFAIKELSFLNYVSFSKGSPLVTLTEKGLNTSIDLMDAKKDVIEPSKEFWDQLSKNNKQKKPLENNEEKDIDEENAVVDDFKVTLKKAIAEMSPKKFETFSRALLNKMGVEFTEQGIQISNDGGIDGYGYHVDSNDFRTTRVVIQCKRYNTSPTGEPEINQFLGAMNKYQADYGVFITNGRYTNAARNAAREGSPITLIDGNDLINLVIKYELYLTPVKTYVLDDFYKTE